MARFCALPSEAPRLSVWRRKQRQQNGKVIIIIQKLSEKDFQFSLMRSARVVGTLLQPRSRPSHHRSQLFSLDDDFLHMTTTTKATCMEMWDFRLSALQKLLRAALFAAAADELTRSRQARQGEMNNERKN